MTTAINMEKRRHKSLFAIKHKQTEQDNINRSLLRCFSGIFQKIFIPPLLRIPIVSGFYPMEFAPFFFSYSVELLLFFCIISMEFHVIMCQPYGISTIFSHTLCKLHYPQRGDTTLSDSHKSDHYYRCCNFSPTNLSPQQKISQSGYPIKEHTTSF